MILRRLNGFKSDLWAAAEYYAQFDVKLGMKFTLNAQEVVSLIKFYPEGRPVIFTSGDVAIRSARINGFPYAVYFAYSKKEDVVYLYGIMHSRRDPKTVRRVMKGREP